MQSGAEGAAPDKAQARWYACYTRARHEKIVERLLGERGFDSYLPMVPRVRRWKDRKKSVDWPLFPSYVFARFPLIETHRVLTTPGLSTIVKVNGMFAPIAEDEIENVRLFEKLLRNGPVVSKPVPFFGRGQWVEVVGGAFTGLRGIVEQNRGRRRVLIGVRAIGQGLELDIDIVHLKPIDPPESAQESGPDAGQ